MADIIKKLDYAARKKHLRKHTFVKQESKDSLDSVPKRSQVATHYVVS